MLGRKVDLRTPEELSRYFRDKVINSALVQYDPDRIRLRAHAGCGDGSCTVRGGWLDSELLK
jgi:hypothetical protein